MLDEVTASLKDVVGPELKPSFLEIHNGVSHAMPKDYFKLLKYFCHVYTQIAASLQKKRTT